MRKAVLLAICFLWTPILWAQTTNVSGTITDTSSTAWKNGTYSFTFLPSPSNPTGNYFQNGVPFNKNQTISGTLDNTASLTSVPVPDNLTIVPVGSRWTFQVCPAATATNGCFSTNLTITGASQNITSAAIPPPVQVSVISPGFYAAYNDAEIFGARQGSAYFNLTDATLHICNLPICTWLSVGTGGGSIGGSISANQVAVGAGVNTIFGDPNFTWLTGSKKALLGDPTSGLNAGTALPPGNWGLQSIHHNTSTSPQDTGVLGIVQADNGVDSGSNHINGGYFSANALTNLFSGTGGGPLQGVQGIGTTSHPTGNMAQVLGGLFTGIANSAGTVTDLAGMAAQAHNFGSGLVGAQSAIRVYQGAVTGGTPPTGNYGIFINPMTGGVNNYAINISSQVQDSAHWSIFTGTGKVEFGDIEIVHGSSRPTETVADQGNVCTNGEVALSVGWQSTGSATVTGVAGNGQTCSWTITTGTTTAANPTITDTLTNPLPEATTVCWVTLHNGTAATTIYADQTTLSATAPVFTVTGTPSNSGATYKLIRVCGP